MAAAASNQIIYPCEKYETEAKKLLNEIEKAKNLEKIRELFNNFAKVYTVIPALWNIWIEKEKLTSYSDYDENEKEAQLQKIKVLAKAHFYFDDVLDFNLETFKNGKFGRAISLNFVNTDGLSFKVNPFKLIPFTTFSSQTIYQALIYPHNDLTHVRAFLNQHAPYPIPSKIITRYKKSKAIAKQIIEHSPRNCLSLYNLNKIQDNNLIIENLESMLGIIQFRKDFWKIYFDYLKNIDDEYERLLNLYSRYCRLFIDDFKIRGEYETELIKQSHKGINVSKWWIDLTKIERSFGKIEESRRILSEALKLSKYYFPDDQYLLVYSLWYYKIFESKESTSLHHEWCALNFPNFDYYSNNIGLKQFYGFRYFSIKRITKNRKPIRIVTEEMPEKFNMTVNSPIEFKYENEFNVIDKPKQLSARRIRDPTIQNFVLPHPLIYYIQKQCKNYILFKLIQTCKQFFSHKKPILCHNLKIMNEEITEPTYVSRSLYITPQNLDFYGLNNLTITNSLNIYNRDTDPKICSTLLPKIKLNISCLELRFQKLAFSEFHILSKQKLKICNLFNIEIQRENGTFLDVVDIINMMPFANRFEFSPKEEFQTLETSEKLSKLQRSVKFKKFTLYKVNQFLDCMNFIEFIKNNAIKNAAVVTYFSQDYPRQQRIEFKNTFIGALPNIFYYVQI